MVFSLKTQKIVTLLITLSIVTIEIAASFNSALLPNLRADLVISEQLAQWTISATLMALAFSGLIYGVLSERYGRRPVILFGMLLFCFGALGSAVASTIEWLLTARVLQGFGAGVGWIVGNACLKDLFDGDDYTKAMNQVHAVAGIVPALAPSLGAYLADIIGWRLCFFLTFLLGVIALIAKIKKLPETHFDQKQIPLKFLIPTYLGLFKNTKYLVFTSIKVMCVMLLFVESANVPLIFVEHLGIPAKYYGFYIIPVFTVYVLGSYFSSKLCQLFSIEKVLGAGLLSMALSNILILVFDGALPLFFPNSGTLTALQIQGLKLLTYLGWGFVFGNATAGLISSAPGQAGAASAMMIALEMVFSSLGIYGLGFFFNGSIIPLSILMLGVSFFCIGILIIGKNYYKLRSRQN